LVKIGKLIKLKLISLDCDSFKIAAAIFVNKKLTKTFIIPSDKKLNSDERGTILYESFCKVLDKEKPDAMVTEKSLYSNNFISSRTITEIIAFCKLACNQRRILYNMVYVPSWKKYITGKGNSPKPVIKECILKIYPELTELTQDELDSIGIGLFYLNNIDKIRKIQ
jgi:Holliday junction resolvasome RuvABC endonuclease subunit